MKSSYCMRLTHRFMSPTWILGILSLHKLAAAYLSNYSFHSTPSQISLLTMFPKYSVLLYIYNFSLSDFLCQKCLISLPPSLHTPKSCFFQGLIQILLPPGIFHNSPILAPILWIPKVIYLYRLRTKEHFSLGGIRVKMMLEFKGRKNKGPKPNKLLQQIENARIGVN